MRVERLEKSNHITTVFFKIYVCIEQYDTYINYLKWLINSIFNIFIRCNFNIHIHRTCMYLYVKLCYTNDANIIKIIFYVIFIHMHKRKLHINIYNLI